MLTVILHSGKLYPFTFAEKNKRLFKTQVSFYLHSCWKKEGRLFQIQVNFYLKICKKVRGYLNSGKILPPHYLQN